MSISAGRRPPVQQPAPAVQGLTVLAEWAGQRLDNYLLRVLKGVPKTHVYRVIRSGEVRVNKGRAKADTRLNAGDVVRVPPMRLPQPAPDGVLAASAPPREFIVLLEDEHLLAIDKPAGVAVHGGSGVSFGVIEQLRRARPQAPFLELVHRLDKETSGVLLLAKRRSTLAALQAQFRERETAKIYQALVWGEWPARLKVIDTALLKTTDAAGERHVRVLERDAASAAPDGARRAITVVKVAQRLGPATLLEVTLKTGRTHQIRAHLAHAGHPIVGDPKYGDFAANRQLARVGVAGARFERMFLHAWKLGFVHPGTGAPVALRSDLGTECLALLAIWSNASAGRQTIVSPPNAPTP